MSSATATTLSELDDVTTATVVDTTDTAWSDSDSESSSGSATFDEAAIVHFRGNWLFPATYRPTSRRLYVLLGVQSLLILTIIVLAFVNNDTDTEIANGVGGGIVAAAVLFGTQGAYFRDRGMLQVCYLLFVWSLSNHTSYFYASISGSEKTGQLCTSIDSSGGTADALDSCVSQRAVNIVQTLLAIAAFALSVVIAMLVKHGDEMLQDDAAQTARERQIRLTYAASIRLRRQRTDRHVAKGGIRARLSSQRRASVGGSALSSLEEATHSASVRRRDSSSSSDSVSFAQAFEPIDSHVVANMLYGTQAAMAVLAVAMIVLAIFNDDTRSATANQIGGGILMAAAAVGVVAVWKRSRLLLTLVFILNIWSLTNSTTFFYSSLRGSKKLTTGCDDEALVAASKYLQEECSTQRAISVAQTVIAVLAFALALAGGWLASNLSEKEQDNVTLERRTTGIKLAFAKARDRDPLALHVINQIFPSIHLRRHVRLLFVGLGCLIVIALVLAGLAGASHDEDMAISVGISAGILLGASLTGIAAVVRRSRLLLQLTFLLTVWALSNGTVFFYDSVSNGSKLNSRCAAFETSSLADLSLSDCQRQEAVAISMAFFSGLAFFCAIVVAWIAFTLSELIQDQQQMARRKMDIRVALAVFLGSDEASDDVMAASNASIPDLIRSMSKRRIVVGGEVIRKASLMRMASLPRLVEARDVPAQLPPLDNAEAGVAAAKQPLPPIVVEPPANASWSAPSAHAAEFSESSVLSSANSAHAGASGAARKSEGMVKKKRSNKSEKSKPVAESTASSTAADASTTTADASTTANSSTTASSSESTANDSSADTTTAASTAAQDEASEDESESK